LRATLSSAGSSRSASRGGFRGVSTADGGNNVVMSRGVSASSARGGRDTDKGGSWGDDRGMSRGVSAGSARPDVDADSQRLGTADGSVDMLRPKKDRPHGPASGEVLKSGEQLEEHMGHTKLLMQAVCGVLARLAQACMIPDCFILTLPCFQREELRNTRVMTPLLLESNLLSEKEARARLSDGEAKYAHAKQHYQRPSSSASIYRPGTNF